MSFRKGPPTNYDLQRRGEFASSPRTMEAIISQWIFGKPNQSLPTKKLWIWSNFSIKVSKKKEISEYHAENHWSLGPLETGLFTAYESNNVHWGSRPWIPGFWVHTVLPWIVTTVTMCHGLNPVPGYVSMACLQNMADVWQAHSGKAETSDRIR